MTKKTVKKHVRKNGVEVSAHTRKSKANPTTDMKNYTIRMPERLKEQIKANAKDAGLPIWEYLQNEINEKENKMMIVIDRQTGHELGTLDEVLTTIKNSGHQLPSDPHNAEYSMTSFDGDNDDDILIYWRE